MNNDIKSTFYSNLIGCSVFTALLIIIEIGFAIIVLKNPNPFSLFILLAGSVMVIAVSLSCVKELISLLLDVKDVKAEKYQTVRGKLVKFTKHWYEKKGYNAETKKDMPVLELDDSTRITFKISDREFQNLQIGREYEFKYLKHSKIAIVIRGFSLIDEE